MHRLKKRIIVPKDTAYTKWLNKHDKLIQRYAGMWVAIRLPEGIVSVGDSQKVYEKYKKKYPEEIPFIYHIPQKDEANYVL